MWIFNQVGSYYILYIIMYYIIYKLFVGWLPLASEPLFLLAF